MKRWLSILSGLAICLGLGAGLARGAAEVQFSAGITLSSKADFYAPLTPYGTWVDVRTYGRCWHPARVEAGWRPYCNGDWEWTDCGWYFASDDPWAWACYHYGRWFQDPQLGWVWVPDVEWAPSWVYWREGGDYIGWAPCPPAGIAIAPAFFVFVDVHHFHERIRPNTIIVNNTTIINRTRLIQDIRPETRTINGTRQRVFVNQGPGVDPIQKATGKRFNPVPIHEAVQHTPAPKNLRQGTLQPTGRERERVIQPQQQPTTQAPRREEAPVVTEPPRERPPVKSETPRREDVRPEQPRETPPREAVPPQTGREKGRVYEEERKAQPQPRERVAPAPEQRPPAEPERGKGREKEKETP